VTTEVLSRRVDENETLGARVRSGVAWKAISQILLQVSRMIVALLVAHLLTPHEWGVAAMVMVVVSFTVVFTDNAFGPALVQKPDLTERDKSTVLWFNAGLGILLAIMGVALAGPLADFYGEPAVRPLFIAASIGFLVSCLGITHAALLMRAMEFRQLELRQIIATVVGGAVGVALALEHLGAWAIIGQQLAAVFVSTALLWVLVRWRPRAAFSLESLRRIGGFAGTLFGENLLFQGGSNFGGLVIGRVLGAAALGQFGITTNVILVPTARVSAPVSQVFLPAFARMSDDREHLTDAWARCMRLVAAVTCPALVGLAILAPDFVPVVLGSQWIGAIVLIQVGAVAALGTTLDPLMSEILLVLNKPGTLFRLTVVALITSVIGLIVGLQWGIVGVMAGYAVAAWINIWIRSYVVTRSLDVSMRRLLVSFAGVAKAVVLMSVVLILGRQALIAADVSPGLTLAVLTAIGGAVYVFGCLRFSPEVRLELRRVRARRRAVATYGDVLSPETQK
jgi:O-antigen/teichoic acid export membrane protein